MLTGHCLVSEGSIVSHNNTAQFAPSKTNHRTKLLTTAALKGSLLILGKGYTGGGLASLLHQNEDWSVTCSVRSTRPELTQDPHLLSCSFQDSVAPGPDVKRAIQESSHILSTIPPAQGSAVDPVLASLWTELQEWGKNSTAEWLGYLSSTSVYGDWGGAWVDERSELRAADPSSRGHRRSLTEQAWAALHGQHGLPVHIFRLGGIYGPGRSAVDSIRQETTSASKQRRAEQLYTNRCHVYDICQVLHASMQQPRPGAVYNVVDDNPASRVKVMAYARQLLTKQPLPQSLSSPQNGSDRRSTEEKRVANTLIKGELGVTLQYPTYMEGLRAIVAGDIRPFNASL